MTTMIMPALMYMVFAIALMAFSAMMGVDISSEMYASVVKPLRDKPFTLNPDKALFQVQGGPEVYDWMTQVFVPELFSEKKQPGDEQGYCTSVFTCLLGEGNTAVDGDASCAGSLVAGRDNCPTYMGAAKDCCQPCVGENCTMKTIWVGPRNLTSNTSVSDLSAACEVPIADWLTDLNEWARDGRTAATEAVSGASDFQYCPEHESKVRANLDTRVAESGRPLMMSQYNRVLMGRVTLKRMKIVGHDSEDFQNAYPSKMAATSTEPSMSRDVEDKRPFGVTRTYTYEEEGGYANAGGFVEFLEIDTQHEVMELLSRLKRNNWFDLNQGSFAAELLLFNGNVNKFMYVTFLFQHDFSGMTKAELFAYPLDLSLHDVTKPYTWVRFLVYLIVIIFFVYFCKQELDEFSSDPLAYISDPMSLVQMVSLSMCLYCIIQYLTIVLSYTFLNFQFPFSPVPSQRHQQFDDLVNLATSLNNFMVIVSVNTCLIFIRCISLMTTLAPQSGIVFNTISQVRYNLAAFCVMFITMLFAFTFTGYFIFGTKSWNFSEVLLSFLTVVKMIMREANLEELRKSGGSFGTIFFLVFHVFFLIVQQIMLCILIHGYQKERERINKMPDSDRYPMKRIWRQTIKPIIQEYSTRLTRCAVFLQQILFGSQAGGTVRINYEQVAKMRDKRATKPRLRTVQYEPKKEEQDEGNKEFLNDVKLRPIQPFYPDGMMHFEVEEVAQNGTAHDFSVAQGFRLVAITHQGIVDRTKFRNKEEFEKKQQAHRFRETTELILGDCSVPLTLEFEGSVRAFSFECTGLMFFIITFLIFVIMVSRVDDSYAQVHAHVHALAQPRWLGYNPTRVMSFYDVDSFLDTGEWLQASVIDKEYECFNPRSDTRGCRTSNLGETKRSGWALWTGLSEGVRVDDRADCTSTPAAVNGLSLGYIPRLPDCTDVISCPDPATEPTCPLPQCEGEDASRDCPPKNVDTPRMFDYNIGVMPNNHVRLTMQVACFQENDAERWKEGVQYVIDEEVRFRSCADEACMKDMIDDDTRCFTRLGREREPGVLQGASSGIRYDFTEEGTYKELGGFAIGLGNTQREAQSVLNILDEDELLAQGTVSFVIESVSYNGNYDMFTYTTVAFSLKATGKLEKTISTSVFPLNAFSMGQKASAKQQKTLNQVCFCLYIASFLVFTVNLIWDFAVQYQITSALQRPGYMTFVDFFTEDWWNVVDVLSVFLNEEVLRNYIMYLLLDGQLVGQRSGIGFKITSFTMDYEFPDFATLAQVDPVKQFAEIAFIYQRFSGLAAVNGLFLMLRFIKYFGGLPALRLVLVTLSSAFGELLIMFIIQLFMLVGFVFMFFTRFGVQFARYGTLYDSSCNLFLFLVGRFEIDDLIMNGRAFFFVVFPIYQITFFLLLNMFLAAICYRWKESRKDAHDFSLLGAWRKVERALFKRKVFSKVFAGASAAGGIEGSRREMLDAEFWADLSMLRHIGLLDENGRISQDREDAVGGGKEGAAERQGKQADEGNEGQEEGGGDELVNLQRRFDKVFQKAHMEIASQMCRTLGPTGRPDEGAGVGDLEEQAELEAAAGVVTEELAIAEDDPLGIREDPVHSEEAKQIRKDLLEKLDQDKDPLNNQLSPAEEIWLDALVTVLEEAHCLELLQRFFLQPPMIEPKKPQEKGIFQQRKRKMQQRLDLFLQWMRDLARAKHYEYLKKMAESKERVLKQQSLVLTDYLETLDENIKTLQEHIKDLERKNARMRSHVSPLL